MIYAEFQRTFHSLGRDHMVFCSSVLVNVLGLLDYALVE